ncbi:DUF4907 domain-containing protein [Flavobacterium sp. LHD-85]|uniref:DUF4907 domain-containing protein n=1 Tax=Flavobacterium sp. LHD-85 TaxID=3071410 RepID=UPI0027E1D342|nr:DUF4907 domain-containing protein [Flavobacterium sp. LHD-85]MDQ6527908.1 DUF4907 domain-containing protein [Flavobacterium sp. LHD-85]
MIINIKKFFWNNIQKNLIAFMLLFLFTACSKKETLTTASFKTNSGWGYTIAYKEKVLIKQSIIPVISNTKSFETESDALKVADFVKQKLQQNLSPTVTKNELILLKIKL